jgi:hypothetical protein
MSKKKRSKNSNYKKKHKEPYSTYDPKIHVRTGSGYHMKKSAPAGDMSGKQLAHILGIK